MGKGSLIEKIDTISMMLYQNKEQEAMQEVAALLEIVQKMGQRLLEMRKDVPEVFIVSTIRELLEAYQRKDMLAMADCLQQKVLLMTEFAESI